MSEQAVIELHTMQLFDACFVGAVQGILQVIRNGINVNCKDSFGYTPLMYALIVPRLSILDYAYNCDWIGLPAERAT